MVEVRISRDSVDILGDEGDVMGVSRLDSSVLAIGDSPVEARISRYAVEVLAVEPDVGAVSRLDSSVLAIGDNPVEARISRYAIEVLAGPDLQGSVTRLDSSVLAIGDSPAGVNISRFSMEALARQGSAGLVEPLALADDAYIFLHNWATKARIATSFRTSVATSPSSGAEARRGLNVKPFRTVDLEWSICDSESVTGINSLEQLERLEVFLRRLTDQRVQVPLYPDQQELAASYTTLDDVILMPTNQGRFFQGARVAIVQLDVCNQPVSHSYHIISDMTNASLTFDAPLGVDIAAGSLVFPLMDCEVALEVSANFSTARVPSVIMTMAEAPGASQLPPLKSDIPTGADQFEDRPVWFEEPDWFKGITKGRKRHGSRSSEGRADFVSLEGDRSRQTHRFQISGNREDMWNALEFFETRRGRLRSFWHIDQDQYMEVVEVAADGSSVGISQNTLDLADTQEEFTHVGVVMADGSHYVRDVTNITAILTKFNIALNTFLPAGLLVSDVHRVARARFTRFTKDEFVEQWTHTGLMTAGISIIEVLNEQDYNI